MVIAKTPTPAANASVALLDAARHIFETDGVQGVSVRRIAQDAGCTTMAVYSRFKGKDGILGALFDEGFEKLAAAQQAVDPSLKNSARVLALCCAFRATAHAYPHHYALMMGSFSGALTPSLDSKLKAMGTMTCLTDAVAAMSSMKGQSRQACTDTANRLFAFCHGWVSLERMTFIADGRQSSTTFEHAVLALVAAKPSLRTLR